MCHVPCLLSCSPPRHSPAFTQYCASTWPLSILAPIFLSPPQLGPSMALKRPCWRQRQPHPPGISTSFVHAEQQQQQPSVRLDGLYTLSSAFGVGGSPTAVAQRAFCANINPQIHRGPHVALLRTYMLYIKCSPIRGGSTPVSDFWSSN